MIFIALGTQRFQFNRLLKKIDSLIENNEVPDDNFFAQTGHSTYTPKHYSYCSFLNRSDYDKYIKQCDLIITHAGVGTILEAKKNKKPVIVVPRLSKYGEHIDDHQKDIATNFSQKKLIKACFDLNALGEYIKNYDSFNLKGYISNNKEFVNKLSEYINSVK